MTLTNIQKNKTPTSVGVCLFATETNKPVTICYTKLPVTDST
jgi:hypothetical protein